MKKKVKLFTTIASLCLAVALMAFGVYAASTVTYTVNGTVKYTMDDVLVDVTTKIYKIGVTTQLEKGEDDYAAALAAQTFTEITASTKNTKTYDEDTNQILPAHKTTSEVTHDGFAVDFNEASAYKIEITINNANAVGIKCTVGTHFTSGTNYTVIKTQSVADGTTVAKGTPLTYTYIFVIDDITLAIPQADIQWQASITKGA